MTGKKLQCLAMLAAAAALTIGGCASPDDKYFAQTKTRANVFVSPGGGDIRKVAIMPFKAATELTGTSVADMFITEVLRTRRYELVERSQLKNVLNEAELALSGLSVSKAAEVGGMLGADGVIIGTVDEYGKTAASGAAYPVVGITARMIECSSGKVVWTVSHAGKAKSKQTTLPEYAREVVHVIMASVYNEMKK